MRSILLLVGILQTACLTVRMTIDVDFFIICINEFQQTRYFWWVWTLQPKESPGEHMPIKHFRILPVLMAWWSLQLGPTMSQISHKSICIPNSHKWVHLHREFDTFFLNNIMTWYAWLGIHEQRSDCLDAVCCSSFIPKTLSQGYGTRPPQRILSFGNWIQYPKHAYDLIQF